MSSPARYPGPAAAFAPTLRRTALRRHDFPRIATKACWPNRFSHQRGTAGQPASVRALAAPDPVIPPQPISPARPRFPVGIFHAWIAASGRRMLRVRSAACCSAVVLGLMAPSLKAQFTVIALGNGTNNSLAYGAGGGQQVGIDSGAVLWTGSSGSEERQSRIADEDQANYKSYSSEPLHVHLL